jgi:hypothetical protein
VIGLWGGYSAAFLQLVGIGSFLVLGLPLLLRPLAWAKVFRWSTGDNSDLAVYFGRCVGAVVCVLSGAAILAARDPAVQPFFFAIAIANFALMVVVHAWGALRRIQPWTETAEIGVWVSLLILGLLCYPG